VPGGMWPGGMWPVTWVILGAFIAHETFCHRMRL